MKLDLNKIENPNALGELFRDITFVKNNKDDYGCYSTFDVHKEFKEINDKKQINQIKELMGLEHDDHLTIYFNSDLNLIVAWHWDGDGTLLFQHKEITIINTDCKKGYTWEFL